jgi:hypothetical protein
MDRRRFMTTSLTGLGVAWAQVGVRGTRGLESAGFASLDDSVHLTALPSDENINRVPADWLVAPLVGKTGVYRTSRKDEIVMSNGLIRRTWRLRPNAASVGLDNLMTGASILRGVKPEAYVELDGQELAVGGLKGQPDYAYLRPEWVDQMTADPRA